ncbi:methyl-accepting chemotaxis protein [Desulfitibacter alkalitolerans]|uniref:methyl-accepting chemotaxis protein n=1 Tax=Desulfitibacter alkalitolerans TaxID=264641 RepID=UPI0004859943|nr:methyl-accepting chemotaxis protein [Desulfitibacter alkalitolerans]
MSQIMLENIDVIEEISKIVSNETGYNIIICGEGGKIIEATIKERIGRIHGGGEKIVSGVIDEALITAEQEERDRELGLDTRKGYNYPIEVEGKRIGSVGIAGDPEIVKPIVKIASKTISLYIAHYLQQKRQEEKNRLINSKISEQIEQVSAAIQELAAGAEEIDANSKSMENIANTALQKADETDGILKIIRDIADRSNMLGLNAAIEAARAGEMGRGFSVVAEEIRKLSTNSRDSVLTVSSVLGEIRAVIDTISEAVSSTSRVTEQQAEALQSVNDNLLEIQRTAADLNKL